MYLLLFLKKNIIVFCKRKQVYLILEKHLAYMSEFQILNTKE